MSEIIESPKRLTNIDCHKHDSSNNEHINENNHENKVVELNNNNCSKQKNNNCVFSNINDIKRTDFTKDNYSKDCLVSNESLNDLQRGSQPNQNLIITTVPNSNHHHQMQQLLQQHVFTANQLQQFINSHTYQTQLQSNQHDISKTSSPSITQDWTILGDITQKQLEHNIVQLQEQLQINLYQQTHLLQELNSERKKNSLQIQQQLVNQQQDIMQTLQIIQKHYLMYQGVNVKPPTDETSSYQQYSNQINT